jgi:signal peptidase I
MSRSRRWVEESLRSGLACELTLRGGSMAPLLRDGDVVCVEPGAPRPGDVVVAERDGRLVTHRLVSLSDGVAVMRGDACRGDDPPLPVSALLGRVVRVKRRSPMARLVGRLLG